MVKAVSTLSEFDEIIANNPGKLIVVDFTASKYL